MIVESKMFDRLSFYLRDYMKHCLFRFKYQYQMGDNFSGAFNVLSQDIFIMTAVILDRVNFKRLGTWSTVCLCICL